MVAYHVDDSMLENLVAVWKNNRGSREDFETPDESSEETHSPFFLAALRDQFRGYLDDSGGDLAAATRMMENAISTIGVSRVGTIPSPLMPHRPEDYPGITEHRESLTNAIDTAGRQWYNDGGEGDIPDGAKYVGTFLLSDDITESQAEDIARNSSRGIDHIISEDGKMISCPSYVHVINFSFGGLVHAIPVGRFYPSLHIPSTAEVGGVS
jgi:hypothetical protein